MKPKQLSKLLSLVLRHRPEAIGIALSPEGWASTQEIIEKINNQGNSIDLPMIEKVVAENDKQRFKLSADKTQIRANQGHSIAVDLKFKAIQPPALLYHGTAKRNLESIMKSGIIKGSRQHVHLSDNQATAIKVGQRHGKPVVLKIDTKAMHEDKLHFYKSENGVWLTDFVDPKYILVED